MPINFGIIVLPSRALFNPGRLLISNLHTVFIKSKILAVVSFCSGLGRMDDIGVHADLHSFVCHLTIFPRNIPQGGLKSAVFRVK